MSPAAARARLLAASHDRLDVQVVANPAGGLRVVQVVIAVSVVILAVIGLANLLTATVVGMRDHRHEVGVLAAMGLTPRQVMATLVVNTMILTALGVASGTAAGLVVAPRLINMQGADQRHRLGHRGQPEPGGDRGDPGRGAGHRRRRGAVPGPAHDQELGLRPPAHPGPPAAAQARAPTR